MTKPIGVCRTDGHSGLWSHVAAAVNITQLELSSVDGESLLDSTFGELRVHFDNSWNTHDDGLIYTDKTWIADFRKFLRKNGFTARAAEAVDYSEAGMQEDDYVSLDVGDPFIIECDRFMNFVNGGKPTKVTVEVSAYD